MTTPNGPSLFRSTSHLAGETAARKNGTRRQQVLAVLRERSSALFEVAQILGVPDHCISGIFTQLSKDLIIERTGERRKTVGGCDAEVWRIAGAMNDRQPDLAAELGYPLTLIIDGELYDRQQLLPSESYPGIPYARRADSGGLQLRVRVALIECPGCGRPLKYVEEAGRKQFRCGTPTCNSTWEGGTVAEPGQPRLLMLVARSF